VTWGGAPIGIQARFNNVNCEQMVCLFGVVPGVTWGSLPATWQAAFSGATINCPTILAKGFTMKHSNRKYALGVGAGDTVEGTSASRVILSTISAFYKLDQGTVTGYTKLKTNKQVRATLLWLFVH
jgi:hypothetical protein